MSTASVASSLWIVDNRGRVKYGNYQTQVDKPFHISIHMYCVQEAQEAIPGARLEYAWVRHPLPHDVR